MNVSLTSKLGQFVRSKVEAGRCTSPREVVREAMRLLEQFEDSQISPNVIPAHVGTQRESSSGQSSSAWPPSAG